MGWLRCCRVCSRWGICGHPVLLPIPPACSFLFTTVLLTGSQELLHPQALSECSWCSPQPASPCQTLKTLGTSKVFPSLKDWVRAISKSFSQKDIGFPSSAPGVLLPWWALWPLATWLGLTMTGRGATAVGLVMELVTALFSPNYQSTTAELNSENFLVARMCTVQIRRKGSQLSR